MSNTTLIDPELLMLALRFQVRLRESTLAGDAFVNQRLAVGDEGGDLGVDATNDTLNLSKLRVQESADFVLLGD